MKFSVSQCKLVTITIEKSTVNNELNRKKIKGHFIFETKFILWSRIFRGIFRKGNLLILEHSAGIEQLKISCFQVLNAFR